MKLREIMTKNVVRIRPDEPVAVAAQTLHAVGSKTDAAQWGIIVLGHYPLDLGGAHPTGNIVKAYVAGESTVQNGVTVNFNGHNAAKFIANVHGHNHCFQFGKLHSVANGQGTEFTNALLVKIGRAHV